MSVPVTASLDVLRAELPSIVQYATALGVEVDHTACDSDSPVVFITFRNQLDARFTAEFDFGGYPDVPPNIEFVDRASGVRGAPQLYPNCFHGMPCVCAKYNRKAYSDCGGPHADWRQKDWQDPTNNSGVPVDSVAMILSDMHAKISATAGTLG